MVIDLGIEMVMQEQESNIIEWGRSLFEVDPAPYNYSGNYYYGGDADHGYANGGDLYEITDSSNVENDEIIAHTLQEEFSQLAVTEGEGRVDDEPLHAHIPGWHFVPPTAANYSSDDGEESDDVVQSSWWSSPGANREEDCTWSPESSNEYGHDDNDEEVNRRLNQMSSIPHVPRINGEIPSIDEATSDHERLLILLQVLGFDEVKVQGDGNCQFRALSDQLYNNPDRHRIVRRQVVNQLKLHPEIYEGYVPMEYDDYLRKMSKSGEWGDHVTLQAAADSYGVEIRVMTSYEKNSCIDILPGNQKPKRTIFLSFWAEVHYNSIYPQEGTTSTTFRKKKKWWNFGN